MLVPARPSAALVLSLALGIAAGATTLQKLGFEEMIQQSTGIVRAKVVGSYAAPVGTNIFTYYKLEVAETFKAPGRTAAQPSRFDVAIPGGSAGGKRQVIAGAPEMVAGQEYVVFYWTSKSGLTQLIGLSQGLFSERAGVSGNPLLVRPAATETMLGKDGNPVQDQPMSLRLSDLRTRVHSVLSKTAPAQGAAK